MNPRPIAELIRRDVALLTADMRLEQAAAELLRSGLPALPVVDRGGRYVGVFGERELIAALSPGYLNQLDYAGFIPKSIEAALEKRTASEAEPVSAYMNTEHVDVADDFADIQLAEIFLHHDVPIVPITANERVAGVVTRAGFVAALAARFLADDA